MMICDGRERPALSGGFSFYLSMRRVPGLRSAVATVDVLAKTQVDPHDHRPLRLPTFPAIERTSVLPLMETSQWTVSAGSAYALVCRSPAAPLWLTQTFSIAGSGAYSRFTFPTGSGTTALPTINGESMSLTDFCVGIPTIGNVDWPTYTGLAVDPASNYWLWVPPGAYYFLGFYLSGTLSSGAFNFEVEYTKNFSVKNTQRRNLAGVINGLTVESTGFSSTGMFVRPLSFSCTVSASGAVNIISLTIQSSSSNSFASPGAGTLSGLMPLMKAPPEYNTAPPIYASCRTNALSVLFQNTTAVLNKEGSVEAITIPLSSFDVTDIISTSLDFTGLCANVTAKCRYAGLLEKGLYTFTLPDARACEFRDCSQSVVGGIGSAPLLNLDSFDYVNLIRFTDYATPASNLFITVDRHHEFRNTTMLWPVGYSTIPLEEWHKAQIVTQSMTPFFENPLHLSAIANLARTAAVKLYPYLRPVAAAAITAARDKLLSTVAGKILPPRMKTNTEVVLRKSSGGIGKKKVARVGSGKRKR